MPERLTVAEFLADLRPFYPTWGTELEKSLLWQLRLPADRKIGKPIAQTTYDVD